MAARKPVDFASLQIQAPQPPPDQRPTVQYYNASVAPPGVMSENEEIIVPQEVAPLKDGNQRKRRRRRGFEEEKVTDQQLQYSVRDTPPWYLSIILGFQHYLIMFGATVTCPLIMANSFCIGDNNLVKSQLIGTIFFVCGFSTLLQTFLGVRLPIVQGGAFSMVTAGLAILGLEKWTCPAGVDSNFTAYDNSTSDDEVWKTRVREIQGAIMVASVAEVIIGFTGIIGFMLRFIGPLTIAPTVALTGLSLFGPASDYASKQWWIALLTIVLIAAFSQYTKNIKIPCFRFERGVGCVREAFPLFRLFPVILAISITWAICAILTVTGVFPKDENAWGSGAKTNLRLDVFNEAPWFRIPYPGQWGTPTVSASSVFGMLSGVLAAMLESVGDYYACARMAHAPPPPSHALNRGIGVEGITCILAGAWGSGGATTSYSENIGAIGITKVASRRVIQVGAVIMLIFGVFGKFGAIFVTIPDPIIGGVFIVMFGMIAAVGISNLQFVDLNSSRNLFIIGFSFFFGLTFPQYMMKHKDAINTGAPAVDQILTVLLRTSMFVAGLAGFFLDNTIPGTDQERGLLKWREMIHEVPISETTQETAEERVQAIYDLPLITPYLKRYSWTRYVPFLPTFDENLISLTRYRKKKKYKMRSQQQGASATDTV